MMGSMPYWNARRNWQTQRSVLGVAARAGHSRRPGADLQSL